MNVEEAAQLAEFDDMDDHAAAKLGGCGDRGSERQVWGVPPRDRRNSWRMPESCCASAGPL